MADNTVLNSGSGGNTVRTLEDASSIHYPVGVVAYATTVGDPDVISIPTAAALSDDMANPTTLLGGSCVMVWDGATWDRLPGNGTDGVLVNLGANNDITLATLPDTAAGDLAAINAAISGTVTVSGAVTTELGTADLDTGAGTDTQAVVGLLLAESGGAVSVGSANPLPISDAGGSLTIDGTVAATQSGSWTVTIQDGGNSITIDGTVTANLGATDNAVLDSIASNTEYGTVVGGGAEATALRVTIANDSTGVLSVDDGGSSLTIDGTVAATQSGTWSARLQDGGGTALTSTLVGADQSLDVNITQSVALDVSAATVTVDNAGTFAVQVDGTALTRLTDIETNTDFGATTGNGTATGALRVTVASDSTGVLSVDDNGGSITVDNNGTFAVQSTLQNVTAASNRSTNTCVRVAGYDGSAYQEQYIDSDGTAVVAVQGRASGGLSTFRSIDLDESEEEVKSTAGTVYAIHAFNTTDAPLYLKLYNATAASTTVGTTTPQATYVIPGNANSDGAGFTLSVPQGIAFSTAITAAVTTGVADSDTGAPAANAAVVMIYYK